VGGIHLRGGRINENARKPGQTELEELGSEKGGGGRGGLERTCLWLADKGTDRFADSGKGGGWSSLD